MKGLLYFPPNAKFLLIRTDSIGDVVLTTPALAALRKRYPASFIAFLCRSYTEPVLQNNPDLNLILKAEDYSWIELSQRITELNFDAAIHFYVEPKTVFATWRAGVPWRIGPFSKFSSLLLNHRVLQHRARVEKHEAEYNLELAERCGAESEPQPPKMVLTEKERKRGEDIIFYARVNPEKQPIIIHPGSAGSVESWPLSHFLELAEKITTELQIPVFFTAGKGEETIIESVKKFLPSPLRRENSPLSRGVSRHTSSAVPRGGGRDGVCSEGEIYSLPAGSLSLRELAAVISNSKMMISNSTGPLHMAVALGVPTLSFYPHRPLVTSAKRWGPFGDSKKHKVLSPEKETDPMSTISVQTAFQSVKEIL